MWHHNGPGRSHQRGASLLEALIGFVLVTIGLLGTAQWQQRLRQATDLSRQQAAAVRSAQDELESLRAIALRTAWPAPAGFDAITDASRTRPADPGANTAQTLSREVTESEAPALKALSVQVDWLDSRGASQRLAVASAIAGQAPVLALALTQAPAGNSAAPRLGRHAAIPQAAADRTDGHSVFKPISDGDEAWLFNRRSGRIVARCTGVSRISSSSDLALADLPGCSVADAVLLSGRVRFALAATPSAAPVANDPPLPIATALILTSRGHPSAPLCHGEPTRLLSNGAVDRPRTLAVAASVDTVAAGLAGWLETGDQWWQFHCAVPRAPPATAGSPSVWSGRLEFAASGWTIGTVPGSQRLCRYSADTDGSGAIDRPAEAPESLSEVEDALTEQNFLVIDGILPCPSPPPSPLAGGSLPWSHANPATVPHQP